MGVLDRDVVFLSAGNRYISLGKEGQGERWVEDEAWRTAAFKVEAEEGKKDGAAREEKGRPCKDSGWRKWSAASSIGRQVFTTGPPGKPLAVSLENNFRRWGKESLPKEACPECWLLPSTLHLKVYIVLQVKNKVKLHIAWDFPGSPVVKTSPPNTEGVGSIPGQGAMIPLSCGQKTRT